MRNGRRKGGSTDIAHIQNKPLITGTGGGTGLYRSLCGDFPLAALRGVKTQESQQRNSYLKCGGGGQHDMGVAAKSFGGGIGKYSHTDEDAPASMIKTVDAAETLKFNPFTLLQPMLMCC